MRTTTAALVDNAGERLREWRLELATAGPRRAAKSFLTGAGWQPAGLIAYEPHWPVHDRMFERAAQSARVDRAALSELRTTRVHGSWIRRRHLEELEAVADYWRLLLMLTDPCAFRPPAYWSLLWALLMAEQRFQNQWVDAWSHEERLTGHFVTTISEMGDHLRPSFEALDRAYKGGAREDPLDGERLPKAPEPPLDVSLSIRLRASAAEVTAWELDPGALARRGPARSTPTLA